MAAGRPMAPEIIEGIPTIELLTELKRRHQVLSRPPTRVAMLGPPCVGRQTQADAFRRAFGVCKISSADLFRPPAEDATGTKDDQAMAALTTLLKRPQCRRGFVLEGFPSTVVQADRLQKLLEEQKLPLQHAVFLDAPEEALLGRCKGRMVHEASGRRYHDEFKPPHEDGVDDFTGEKLVRPPVEDEKFREKLEKYKHDADLLRTFYDRSGMTRSVSAAAGTEEVAATVAAAVDGAS
eukprot:gnl/TRDRNA2_/TRDRNA2_29721_c0_seq1.p1 gnl/TRDRNA2_/TRDRNA2_29721_c0~~gnl/TRDRNA2_/TRDRNA2_29721_c0_seq1.p1  ORF type:complete len:250 (+),score=50.90 gnl/TRDRNA2_/TRDRNA2_29721_c0_seq1:42-752(+)